MDYAYIYVITNKFTNKVYVGSTAHPNKRWQQHKSLLYKGTHKNRALQHSWKKCGEKHFTFDFLEQCDVVDRYVREEWWIVLLNARDSTKGYNVLSATEPKWYLKWYTKHKGSTKNRPKNKSKKHQPYE